MNLGSIFSRHAQYRPKHTALIFRNKAISWFKLNQKINRLANALIDKGIKKGDKIATILPNSLELFEAYWAASKIGAVIVPLSSMLLRNSLLSLLKSSDAVMIILDSEFIDSIESIREELPIKSDMYILAGNNVSSNFISYGELIRKSNENEPSNIEVVETDVFDIIYSSGTTGLPKGIIHTHYIRIMYGACFASSFRITPESIVMHAGSIIFNGAFVDLMPAIFVGATYILMEKFEPKKYIETIKEKKVTHVMLVPSQIIALMESPDFSADNLESLEMILSLGAPFLSEHKERINSILPNRIYELYGLTEGFVTILDKNDYLRKPTSVGVPPPLFDIKIVDDKGIKLKNDQIGEICGKGPILTPGYYNRPDLTKKSIVDGWMYSGDVGFLDEEGFLYLIDRKKDMIISGGVNVYPRDIEEIIIKHPAVSEVAVVGIKDKKWGETPAVAIKLIPDIEEILPQDLKTWINNNVGAKFQRVSKVVLVDEFPKTVSGKILKRELTKVFEPI